MLGGHLALGQPLSSVRDSIIKTDFVPSWLLIRDRVSKLFPVCGIKGSHAIFRFI